MNERISPETAVALLEIAKDLTLAAAGKTTISVPDVEYHARTGTDLTLLFKTCVSQVENQYRSLLSDAQEANESGES